MIKPVLLVLIIITVVSATRQVPDRLIIDGDTLTLQEYPLEDITLEKRPFTDSSNPKMLSTACYRGYAAEWIVRNDSLFLSKVFVCHSQEFKTGESLFNKNSHSCPK